MAFDPIRKSSNKLVYVCIEGVSCQIYWGPNDHVSVYLNPASVGFFFWVSL